MGSLQLALTGQPEISFFKTVYRSHMNFAQVSCEEEIVGRAGLGNQISFELSARDRSDEEGGCRLLGSMMLELEVELEEGVDPSTLIGYEVISKADLVVGGKVIETMSGEWMAVWSALFYPIDKYEMLCSLMKVQGHFNLRTRGKQNILSIPLMFGCCLYSELALPLFAMENSPVKVYISFKGTHDLIREIHGVRAYVDYYLIDGENAHYFSQGRYLHTHVEEKRMQTRAGRIEQIEFRDVPRIKSLVWVRRKRGGSVLNPEKGQGTAKILIGNGYGNYYEVQRQNSEYFYRYQRYKYARGGMAGNGIHVWNGAGSIDMCDNQYSGFKCAATCNYKLEIEIPSVCAREEEEYEIIAFIFYENIFFVDKGRGMLMMERG